MMEDRTLFKVGGICSVLLGLSYLVIGVTFLLDPVRTTVNRHEVLVLLAQQPLAWVINHLMFAFGAILALGAVPAISAIVRQDNEGWVCWAMNIAYLGIIITALTHIQFLTLTPVNARIYVEANDAARAAFLAAPISGIDINGWFRYGCLGLWMLIVCLVGLQGGTLMLRLVYLGIAGSVLYLMIPLSSTFPFAGGDMVETIAAILGGILVGPAWFIGMGAHLYRLHRASKERSNPCIVVSQ